MRMTAAEGLDAEWESTAQLRVACRMAYGTSWWRNLNSPSRTASSSCSPGVASVLVAGGYCHSRGSASLEMDAVSPFVPRLERAETAKTGGKKPYTDGVPLA